MFMLPLLNSIFIYQALIPQFICGIYRFLRKIATICLHNTIILITPQKYEKELKLTNILRDICIYSFLFTQTLWLPRPSESIGEVLSFVSSFSSIEAAVRLRLLMEA